MDHALAWAVTGLVLVIAELLTGTFYLVMLGVAAFGAAGAAYLGGELYAEICGPRSPECGDAQHHQVERTGEELRDDQHQTGHRPGERVVHLTFPPSSQASGRATRSAR